MLQAGFYDISRRKRLRGGFKKFHYNVHKYSSAALHPRGRQERTWRRGCALAVARVFLQDIIRSICELFSLFVLIHISFVALPVWRVCQECEERLCFTAIPRQANTRAEPPLKSKSGKELDEQPDREENLTVENITCLQSLSQVDIKLPNWRVDDMFDENVILVQVYISGHCQLVEYSGMRELDRTDIRKREEENLC